MPRIEVVEAVRALADGDRTANEIARVVGVSRTTVKRVLAAHSEIPRRKPGMPEGERAPSYRSGRSIQPDGYVLVSAPRDHPHARRLPGRRVGRIAEHRLVVEQKLGRYLLPTEVVDHIDGLTLHNSPENLRLYRTNGDHLSATTSGISRRWSKSGHENIGARTDRGREIQPYSTYDLRKKRGDVRLRQILLAVFQLGIDSPYLSGTRRHLEKAGIVPDSRPSLERGWRDLCRRWQSDLDR